jgi:hypothetical protein
MKTQVFAFAKIDDKEARTKVYEDIKNGRSRFGMFDQSLSLKEEWYGKNSSLLSVKKGDWIVHVNMPNYGKCIAVKTTSEYQFDEGIKCSWGNDFNNFFYVDIDTIIEFDRNNSNILPSVNLAPRRRVQRISKVRDFLISLENLKNGFYDTAKKEDICIIHLQNKVEKLLPQITSHIQEMNRSKNFESFLHRIFSNMPNTVSIQNGSGWGTDHGADLIVEFDNPIVGINVTTKLIIQAKSYIGEHFDTNAIDQIAQGISEFNADAGLLITTATETEALEDYIKNKSDEIGKTIDVIAGTDVARFVLRYAPELLL